MKNFRITVLGLLALMVLSSCGGAPKASTAQKVEPKFEMAEPPITLTSIEGRKEWMVLNFWNRFNLADTTFIGGDALRNAFGVWAMLLVEQGAEKSRAPIFELYRKAEAFPLMHAELLRLGEGYMGEPNSELRNDSLYIMLLEYELQSPILDSLGKIRPAAHLKMTLSNRVGQRVPNFSFTAIDGKKGNLYGVKAKRTLLYFYTPGCEACKAVTNGLTSEPNVVAAVESGYLRIIAVYCDMDDKLWRDFQSKIPDGWSNVATDSVFKAEQPFAIRATPSLYLLDESKRVLVRDGVSAYDVVTSL